MSYIIPTFATIQGQILADIQAATGESLIEQDDLYILAMACAAQIAGLYVFNANVANHSLPFNATGSILEGWARLKNLQRKPATPSTNTVTFTGTAGVEIPEGTVLVRADNATFTTNNIVAVGGSVGLTSTAQGSNQNGIASALNIQSPITGVFPTVTPTTPFVGGTDQELDAALLLRVIDAYKDQYSGGNANDFTTWCLEVPIVTRAWTNPQGAGEGTVVCYIMCDDEHPNSTPSLAGFPVGTNGVDPSDDRDLTNVATGDQLEVASYLWNGIQPVGAQVYVCSPVAYPVNVIIQGLTNNSSAIQAAIESNLVDLFLTSVASPKAVPIYLNQISSAIQNAVGTGNYNLMSPTGPINAPLGSLPVLGTVTYE